MRCISAIVLMAFALPAWCQDQSTKDTSGPSSYFDVNIGMGNSSFSARKANATRKEWNQLNYFFGAGYYHKSGFSLSVEGYATNDEGSMVLYQTLITPAYEYDKAKHFGFGVSYTRMETRDSVSFYQSPLKDQFSAYLTWKNKIIQPTLNFTYGKGTTSVVRLVPLPPRKVSVSASEYNFNLDLVHTATASGVFTKGDELKTAPGISFYAGQNQYGGLNPRQRRVAARAGNNSFQLQDVYLNVELTYTISDLYIQPNLMLDYYCPKASSKWYPLFSLTLGYDF